MGQMGIKIRDLELENTQRECEISRLKHYIYHFEEEKK
jgi:hypothetical protein